MTDSAESRLLLRLQSTGSNVNLWGGYLDTNQQMLARASKGYQSIAMTGDQTISWTNYSLTNVGAVRTIKLTGSLGAAANLVVPSLEMDFNILNSTGQTITVKTSAGVGIAVPNGARMALYCDATDVYQSSPTNISVFTPSSNYDLTTKTYVDTAIAAATTSTTPGTLRVTASDTTAKFLFSAITTQFSSATTTQLAGLQTVQWTTLNAGGNEQAALSMAAPYVGGFLPGGDAKTSGFTPVVGTAYEVNCISATVTVALGSMTTPQLGQMIFLNNFGSFPMLLKGTVNGGTDLFVTSQSCGPLRYCGLTWGWN